MAENTHPDVNYAGYPIFRVRILAQKVAWLIVRLSDGKKGIIPKREWSWTRGNDQNVPDFVEGAVIHAVLLRDSEASGFAYLSIKELHNPWQDADKKFHLGDEVLGEVVNIRKNAAYIEVAPGVTAVLWANDMPLLPEQIPSDFLTIGDRLYAVITDLNFGKKRMQVSVTAWFQRLDATPSSQKERLERVFKQKLDALTLQAERNDHKLILPGSKEHQVRPLGEIKKILVIDDNPVDREQIINQLTRVFSVEIIPVESGEAGLLQLDTVKEINLIILDIGLDHDEYGPMIGAKILQQFPQMHIIFSSSDPFRFSEVLEFEKKVGRIFPFIQKSIPSSGVPPDESLAEVIHLLQNGLVYRFVNTTVRNKDGFMEQLSANSLTNAPLKIILEDTLSLLARSSFIEYAVVLELDSLRKELSIVACYPPDQEQDFTDCLDGIYYSQVRDVIEDEEILYVDHISREMKASRFKNFFRRIRFHSCYGVPIHLSGSPVRHGLFVLDTAEDFSWETIMRIRTTANHVSVAQDRAELLKILRKYEERYFIGQLFGTFIHELKNNFEALDGNFELTKTAFSQNKPDLALKRLNSLERTVNDLKALTNSYVRFVNEGIEEININEIIQKALRQLEHIAQIENHVKILVDLEEDIPPIWANALHVEQVILNVVLNAIQHVSMQYRSLTTVSEVRDYAEPLQLCRAVWVNSCLFRDGKMCRITVMDTGPGVPFDQRDKIFREGISSRAEGHGLGLFISKNLAEAMQGKLFLLESIRFTGSAFVITFPIY